MENQNVAGEAGYEAKRAAREAWDQRDQRLTEAPCLILFVILILRMNEVLKNTHVFVDILSMARCDAVQQWDEAAFEKSYKWASYFEEASNVIKYYKTRT